MRSSLTVELEKYTSILEQTHPDRNDNWRLGYHVMPPVGWLNDPNGLCYFNGAYHLFFQYSPSDPAGALKYWGHYVSQDLLSWEYKGIALYPDMPYDCNGVYSGSALAEEDECWIFYTGNVKLAGDYDYVRKGREGNTVAVVMDRKGNFSDKKLLMRNEDYPKHLTCHVRDPKVWKEEDTYYMVLGARTKEDRGCVLVYSSKDKLAWFLENILETKEAFGFMWECPDMFVLDGQRFLSVSPQGLETKGLDYANVYQSGYMELQGDFRRDYTLGSFFEYDRGFDFYAPQTFEDETGRRILIGWMGMPDCDYGNPTVQRGWQHCMTVPRELTAKKGRILQKPVREVEASRRRGAIFQGTVGKELAVDSYSDMEIAFEEGREDFLLCIDEDFYISYHVKTEVFAIGFRENSPLGGGRTYRGKELKNLKNLRILLDSSSVEIFVNDGEEVFSSRIYPAEGSRGHTLKWGSGKGKIKIWSIQLNGCQSN